MRMVLVDEKDARELVGCVAKLIAMTQRLIEVCKMENKDKDKAIALCVNMLSELERHKAIIEAQERTIERLKFNLITGGNRAGFSSS